MKTFYDHYFNFINKQRWLIFISIFILVVFAASGVRFLRINGDLNVYFGKDNPQMQNLNNIHQEYEKTDNLAIVIAPENKDVFTNKTLGIVEALVDTLWKAPFVSRVDAISNYQYVRNENNDLSISSFVENADEISPEKLKKLKTVALSDSLIIKRLVSSSGHVTGIFLTVNFPHKDYVNEGPSLIKYVKDALKKYESKDQKVYLTGTVMVDQAFADSGAQDMATLIPLMILIVIAFVYFFSRSWTSTLSSLFIVITSAIVAMGIFGFMGVDVTSTLISGPIMIMTIVIADGIHFFFSVVLGMKEGLNKEEAIKESIRLNFMPLLLTTITTVLGYISMNLSDSPPFRDLGNLVCIGATVGWILSILWLPAILLILPIQKRLADTKLKIYDFSPIGKFVTRKWKVILLVTVISTAALTPFIYNNKINDMFLDFFSDSLPIKQDTKFTVDNLTGIYSIEYSLKAKERDGVSEPEYLKAVESFGNWFKKQDNVIQETSVVGIIKKMNQAMHGDSGMFYKLPESKEAAAQYLFLYEMSTPLGVNLTNMVNLDKSATRFRVTFKNMYTEDLKKVELAANQWLKDNAPSYMFSEGTSTSVMFRYLSERNIQFMIEGFLIGVITIVVALMFATKSFRLGLITFLPNILPSLIAFSIWGLLVGKVGLAVAFVTSFTLGIVVDNTIHFIIKYKRIRKTMNLNPEEATIETFRIAGSSMFVSTLILVFGFLILIFSPFQLNSSMGVLSALTLALSLVYDFLLTPSLVLMLESFKKTKENKTQKETENEIITYSEDRIADPVY